ncbi:MAG TPA: DNA recombination protein RmuC [Oscillospiraceae bacterium]|nr:DNA recombination protein RmuC [Oscillospiraceae bacterium]
MEYLPIIISSITLIVAVIMLIIILNNTKGEQQAHELVSLRQRFEELSRSLGEDNRASRSEITQAVSTSIKGQLDSVDKRLESFNVQTEQRLDNIRTAMTRSLTSIQEDTSKKLDEMRQTVDEKLQKTLDEKLSRSFASVSQRLEEVHKGLGEMQALAVGVGDLKKVLSNVKTRGILGEIQLGAIIEQILAPEQYEENVVTKVGTQNRVEFAVKLPGDDTTPVYLPIDAKFHADCYSNLVDAYEKGDPVEIESASKTLVARIKQSAKDIRDKYIDPPNTTEFAIMFLPFEGLYAEVVRHDLMEVLAREYKVNIAGPSTMAALLNSLQMGFRTLAIQKSSNEVWKVLGAVKTEFDKFGDVLLMTQQRLEQANSELDKLVGVRTRQIQRRLSNVTSLTDDSITLLSEEIENNV